MTRHAPARPFWSTASFGDTVDTTPGELSSLGEHLTLCQSGSGRLFNMRCIAEATHRFVAGRMVTTLAVVVLVLGFGMLLS